VSTLDVVDLHPERFSVFALTAATNVDRMLAQCVQYQPQFAVMDSLEHQRSDLARTCEGAGPAHPGTWRRRRPFAIWPAMPVWMW